MEEPILPGSALRSWELGQAGCYPVEVAGQAHKRDDEKAPDGSTNEVVELNTEGGWPVEAGSSG